MNRTDYILTITKGILEAPEEITAGLIEYFSAIFELKEMQKPGFVVLAAGLENGKDGSFTDWVKALRVEKVKKCVLRSSAQEAEKLPAHIAAAFAGAQEYLFEVITEKTAHCYVIRSIYSPQYAITTELFTELTDAQTNSAALWQLVAELITESNELNGRKTVDKSVVKEYLNSREGKEEFNFLASKLSEEMQIECVVTQSPFIFPQHLQHLFYQSDFSFYDGADREIAFLYTLKACSAEELLMLVQGQPFAADIWAQCEKELKEYPREGIPVLAASEFEAYIKSQTTEALNQNGIANIICVAIRTLSEQHHVRPAIPEALKDVFGPDKKEYDKALARGNVKDRWYLKSNEKPWEICYFEPVDITTLLEPEIDLKKAKQEFAQALSEIEGFAKKIQSSYQEAFRFAGYFLSAAVPAGNYDPPHLEIISKDLEAKGFSERAIQILVNNFLYLEEWHKMKFDTETILGLFAVNNADHFGGMGSWNDQYVEEDPETYNRVSARTFDAMKKYFVSLLSK
ncbi:hypothetical protein [Cytophaga hutchinsonii]|nr:hypothetical protein [Cytophaga hutchinsonii]SFX44867.1 hypothetical protein SAMN04487930_104152 [Cytophaga hutchinsonii ATCC 33406]